MQIADNGILLFTSMSGILFSMDTGSFPVLLTLLVLYYIGHSNTLHI